MKIKQEAMSTLKTVVALLVVGIAFSAIQAEAQSWTPPGGNVPGPLTTGTGSQTKSGGDISLSGGGSLYAGGLVAAPKLCIGADCRTAWPTAGSTGLTDYNSLPSGSVAGYCAVSINNAAIGQVFAPAYSPAPYSPCECRAGWTRITVGEHAYAPVAGLLPTATFYSCIKN